MWKILLQEFNTNSMNGDNISSEKEQEEFGKKSEALTFIENRIFQAREAGHEILGGCSYIDKNTNKGYAYHILGVGVCRDTALW